MPTLFIQANRKQLLGAALAKFAAERNRKDPSAFGVEIVLVEDVPAFRAFAGRRYRRKGREVVYDPQDLQSFTLTRFMPPALMGRKGRAVVIDPDIFALADPTELFDLELGEAPVAACRKKDAWDTSVMVLDCARLPHWDVDALLADLAAGRADYDDWMSLRREPKVRELPRLWNSLDRLTTETKMLHTTERLTQPWRTGLPIDFTRNPLPKVFGLVPREPILKLLGKYPSTYQPHPDLAIEKFFFGLLRDALAAGAVTEADVDREVAAGHVRKDVRDFLGGRSNG